METFKPFNSSNREETYMNNLRTKSRLVGPKHSK
jgi:hypothetical protein